MKTGETDTQDRTRTGRQAGRSALADEDRRGRPAAAGGPLHAVPLATGRGRSAPDVADPQHAAVPAA